jgi:hypothetical protein
MRHTVNNYNIRLPIAHWSPYDPLGRLDGQAIPLLSLLSPMGFPKSQVSGFASCHKPSAPRAQRDVRSQEAGPLLPLLGPSGPIDAPALAGGSD